MKTRTLGTYSLIACIVLASVSLLLPQASAATGHELICREGVAFPAGPLPHASANGRQYAPDRLVDVTHLKIEVTPDFDKRSIAATTTLTFAPIARPLSILTLDAIDLDVSKVTGTVDVADYEVNENGIVITFAEPVQPKQSVSVTVQYTAEPQDGLFFRTPAMGYREGDTHLWTQGEAHLHRHWFPSVDYPNEKFTTEMICHVPTGMIANSNGKLIKKIDDRARGKMTFHFMQEKPHVNYLVALTAGNFQKIETKHGDLKMAFYTPPSRIQYAQNSFEDTLDIMKFLEKEIGVKYPWAKYDQVVVDDFVAGGMENTTITILTHNTLFPDETENLRSSTSLVAHELAHQWFGDYLTCKDWSHLWLNEGFATYYAHLYSAHKDGQDELIYRMRRDASRIFRADANNPKPIVYRNYNGAGEQFDHRAYAKGGWVLHMLRNHLGADLYRKGITEYVKRNALTSVETTQLQAVLEEVSGLSLQQFFDQWVHHAGYPSVKVSYKWDASKKLARISMQQTQKVDGNVLLFKLPIKLRFKTEQGVFDHVVTLQKQQEDFYISLPAQPKVVRFDPDATLLVKLDFNKPASMTEAQLSDTSDMLGRLLAVETLGKSKTGKTVDLLKNVLNSDSFYGVRTAASQALRGIGTDAAIEALVSSIDQSDARVRSQVVSDIARIYRPESKDLLVSIVNDEKNPMIVAAAIGGLAKYLDSEIGELLKTQLDRPSYGNMIETAAISALRQTEDGAYALPLLHAVKQNATQYESRALATGLGAVGYLGQYVESKTEIRDLLVSYLSDPRRMVKLAAIAGLGDLGDPTAIAIIESYTENDVSDFFSRTADAAITKLRNEQPPRVEVQDLRTKVKDLEQQNQKLQKQVKEILEQINAESATPVE